MIPEVLKDKCAQCNEKNKADIKKILSHFKNKKADSWKLITAKFDPSGTNVAEFESFLNN